VANPLHVIHICPELSYGGAEIVLLNIIRGTKASIQHHVITTDVSDPKFVKEVRSAGADVSLLPGFRRFPIKFMAGTRAIVCAKKPAVVHSWMYRANVASMVLPRHIPVVWSFHGESISSKLIPRMVELSLVPASYLLPSAIVFPSKVSFRNYKRVGFNSRIFEYIHNPVDISVFCPDVDAGKRYRAMHHYSTGTVLGCAARWHPKKGHLHLFDSLKKALDDGADVRLVCAGRDMVDRKPEVMDALKARGLRDRVTLVGLETNMRAFYNSIDMLVVPSQTEAFGNVIIEAYGCGVPVLSTSCGGPLEIIADLEHIVPVDDVPAMAAKICQYANGQWRPSTEGLQEYAKQFSLPLVSERYADLYRRLA